MYPVSTISSPTCYAGATMTSQEDNPFGKWLQQELADRNLSYSRFAQMARVSPTSVKLWISGGRQISERSCDPVADALGVSRNFVRRLANRPDTDDDPIAADRRGEADRNIPVLSREQIEALEAFLELQKELHGHR